ncbi:MAG: hypothetical protein WBZ51_36880, partial [Xanthobacteraceae bacterium]
NKILGNNELPGMPSKREIAIAANEVQGVLQAHQDVFALALVSTAFAETPKREHYGESSDGGQDEPVLVPNHDGGVCRALASRNFDRSARD